MWVVTGTDAARGRAARRARSTARRSRTASPSPLAPERCGGAVVAALAGACTRPRARRSAGRRTCRTARARVLFYRRIASPLHATRAGVGALWALALTAATLLLYHPLALLALLVRGARSRASAPASAASSRARCAPRRSCALPIVLVNVLVSRDGLTVFARLGDLGPFGQGNLTVEAVVYGAVIALKVTLLMLVTTLASLAVDPDETAAHRSAGCRSARR